MHRGGGVGALTRRTGGGWGVGANEAHGGGGGGLALTRRTGGGGGVGTYEAQGGGGLALTRHAPSPICTSYNEARSFSQTLHWFFLHRIMASFAGN